MPIEQRLQEHYQRAAMDFGSDWIFQKVLFDNNGKLFQALGKLSGKNLLQLPQADHMPEGELEYIYILSVRKPAFFWRKLLPTIAHPASTFQKKRCEEWLSHMQGLTDVEEYTLFYGYAILVFL